MTENQSVPTPAPTAPSHSTERQPSPGAGASNGAERLTVVAGWSILVISLLHTVAFARHPYWLTWLAGPFRTAEPSMAETAQFWGLPGGFVVPAVVLGLVTIWVGRQGRTLPAVAGWILGIWAVICIWMVGPSGFLFVLVPSVLLIVASFRRGRNWIEH